MLKGSICQSELPDALPGRSWHRNRDFQGQPNNGPSNVARAFGIWFTHVIPAEAGETIP